MGRIARRSQNLAPFVPASARAHSLAPDPALCINCNCRSSAESEPYSIFYTEPVEHKVHSSSSSGAERRFERDIDHRDIDSDRHSAHQDLDQAEMEDLFQTPEPGDDSYIDPARFFMDASNGMLSLFSTSSAHTPIAGALLSHPQQGLTTASQADHMMLNSPSMDSIKSAAASSARDGLDAHPTSLPPAATGPPAVKQEQVASTATARSYALSTGAGVLTATPIPLSHAAFGVGSSTSVSSTVGSGQLVPSANIAGSKRKRSSDQRVVDRMRRRRINDIIDELMSESAQFAKSGRLAQSSDHDLALGSDDDDERGTGKAGASGNGRPSKVYALQSALNLVRVLKSELAQARPVSSPASSSGFSHGYPTASQPGAVGQPVAVAATVLGSVPQAGAPGTSSVGSSAVAACSLPPAATLDRAQLQYLMAQSLYVPMFMNASVPMLCRAPDFRILDMNMQFERVTGFPREEVVGYRSPFCFREALTRRGIKIPQDYVKVQDDKRPDRIKQDEQILSGSLSFAANFLEFLFCDGRVHNIMSYKYGVRDVTGRVQYFVHMIVVVP